MFDDAAHSSVASKQKQASKLRLETNQKRTQHKNKPNVVESFVEDVFGLTSTSRARVAGERVAIGSEH